eukprot:PhF_6_TR31123/c1_g1_i1/m.45556
MDSILGPVDCPQFHDWDCQENEDLKSPKYFLRRQPPRSTASQAFPRRQQVIQKKTDPKGGTEASSRRSRKQQFFFTKGKSRPCSCDSILFILFFVLLYHYDHEHILSR